MRGYVSAALQNFIALLVGAITFDVLERSGLFELYTFWNLAVSWLLVASVIVLAKVSPVQLASYAKYIVVGFVARLLGHSICIFLTSVTDAGISLTALLSYAIVIKSLLIVLITVFLVTLFNRKPHRFARSSSRKDTTTIPRVVDAAIKDRQELERVIKTYSGEKIRSSIEKTPLFENLIQAQQSLTSAIDFASCLVIGVDASWGSGKTSLMNLVKESLNERSGLIWIDFKALAYSNSNELLSDLFLKLENDTGVDLGSRSEQIVNMLTPTFEAAGLSSLTRIIFNKSDLESNILKLKETLNQEFDGKIIVNIDDIDRLYPEEIITIFKAVATLSQIPSLTFVLSFDFNRVGGVISKALGPEYRDFVYKIVTHRIKLQKYTYEEMQAIFESGLGLATNTQELTRSRPNFQELWEQVTSALLYNFIESRSQNLGSMYEIQMNNKKAQNEEASIVIGESAFGLETFNKEFAVLGRTIFLRHFSVYLRLLGVRENALSLATWTGASEYLNRGLLTFPEVVNHLYAWMVKTYLYLPWSDNNPLGLQINDTPKEEAYCKVLSDLKGTTPLAADTVIDNFYKISDRHNNDDDKARFAKRMDEIKHAWSKNPPLPYDEMEDTLKDILLNAIASVDARKIKQIGFALGQRFKSLQANSDLKLDSETTRQLVEEICRLY